MDDIKDTSAAADWVEIEKLFPTRTAMRPNKAWTNGISTRAGAGRLSRVMANPGAGLLAAKLDQMDDARIKALRTFAAINLEQANYGFRVTTVMNITIPVLVLTILSQVTSGNVGALFFDIFNDTDGRIAFAVATTFAVIMVTIVMTHVLSALSQARDIRHIIDLHAAERGIYFGLEDSEDLHSP